MLYSAASQIGGAELRPPVGRSNKLAGRLIEVGEDLGRCDDIGAFDRPQRPGIAVNGRVTNGVLGGAGYEPPVPLRSVVFTPRAYRAPTIQR